MQHFARLRDISAKKKPNNASQVSPHLPRCPELPGSARSAGRTAFSHSGVGQAVVPDVRINSEPALPNAGAARRRVTRSPESFAACLASRPKSTTFACRDATIRTLPIPAAPPSMLGLVADAGVRAARCECRRRRYGRANLPQAVRRLPRRQALRRQQTASATGWSVSATRISAAKAPLPNLS